LEDIVRNQNSKNGRKIYTENDDYREAVGKILGHAYKSLKPSVVGQVERAVSNENKLAELSGFLGFRPYEVDLHKSFSISLSRMVESLDDVSSEFIDVKLDKNSTPADIEKARIKAGEKKAEVIMKYNKLYTTLIKLGASRDALDEIVEKKSPVKMTGMDKKTKAGIKEGLVDPTTLY
jgi:hypothetical protein